MLEQPARVFSSSLKERIVLRLEGGERIRAVAAETGIRRKLLYAWRDAYRSMGVAGFNRKRGPKPGWKERRAAEGRAPSAPPSSPELSSQLGHWRGNVAARLQPGSATPATGRGYRGRRPRLQGAPSVICRAAGSAQPLYSTM